MISTGYQTPHEQQEAAAWPVIETEMVVGNLDSPVHITHAGDGSGRLFVVEQPGMIKILFNGSIQGTFLDISDRVRSIGNEEGLLSLAFPPGYGPSLPYFYVYYTQQDGNNIVSRFSISGNPDLADPASEEKILVLSHPTHSNHNGGQIAFGPDGYCTSQPGMAAVAETRRITPKTLVHCWASCCALTSAKVIILPLMAFLSCICL